MVIIIIMVVVIVCFTKHMRMFTGLSLFWTEARKRGFSVRDVQKFLCENPARLCQIDDRKGSIAVGKDADFVIWDPNSTITVVIFRK